MSQLLSCGSLFVVAHSNQVWAMSQELLFAPPTRGRPQLPGLWEDGQRDLPLRVCVIYSLMNSSQKYITIILRGINKISLYIMAYVFLFVQICYCNWFDKIIRCYFHNWTKKETLPCSVIKITFYDIKNTELLLYITWLSNITDTR